jgi:DNA-directed RNA polymerase specialized sigma24 family protein
MKHFPHLTASMRWGRQHTTKTTGFRGGQMRQGRTEDYAQFATARAGHLYRSACLLTAGDTYLAEDLVQEALGKIYARWGRISRAGNPAAYAQTALTRTFLAHQRRRSSRERTGDVLPDLVAAPP